VRFYATTLTACTIRAALARALSLDAPGPGSGKERPFLEHAPREYPTALGTPAR
jgi:hypothetical protein